MGSAEGIRIGGANMWDLLRDEEPGNRTTTVDNRKHRKAAAPAAVAEVEEAPPADKCVPSGRGAVKPAKRVKKTKTMTKKKGTTVDDGEERINGHEAKKTPAAPPSELEETSENEEEVTGEVAARGSRCRTVDWRMFRAAFAVAVLALYCQLASPLSDA